MISRPKKGLVYSEMLRRTLQKIIISLVLLINVTAHAQDDIHSFVISDGFTSQALSSFNRYLEDAEGKLTLEELLDPQAKLAWQTHQSDTENNNFGYTSSVYWFHTKLINQSQTNDYVLEIAYPVIDHLDFYWVIDGEVLSHHTMGDKYPFDQRLIEHRNFLVPIEVSFGERANLYIRVKTTSSMQVPLILRSEPSVLYSTETQVMGLSMYYGMIIVMVLYNLFVFVSVREINYFYYVCYVMCMLLFLASLNGVTFQYLWPNSIWWNDQSIVVMLSGVVVFASLFTRHFLDLPSCRPKLNVLFWLLMGLGVSAAVASLILPYHLMIKTTISISLIAIALTFLSGILRFRDGYTPAKYYVYAWSFMLMGGVVLALNKAAILPRNLFTENAVQIGSAIEVILLSLALADRLNAEKTERYEAQMQALEIQKRATETLERRVHERTAELEKANLKLQELSTTDGLTGVRNRRFFDECLEYEFFRSVREQQPMTVMLIDVDHFKAFNDLYGHLVGDDCLIEVAQTVQAQLKREVDIVARYGGEEFSILLSNTSPESARALAEQMRLAIRAIRIEDTNKQKDKPDITASFGLITIKPLESDSPQFILAAADRALYRSKDRGRDMVTVATPNDVN